MPLRAAVAVRDGGSWFRSPVLTSHFSLPQTISGIRTQCGYDLRAPLGRRLACGQPIDRR
jgi:hypothetical protein